MDINKENKNIINIKNKAYAGQLIVRGVQSIGTISINDEYVMSFHISDLVNMVKDIQKIKTTEEIVDYIIKDIELAETVNNIIKKDYRNEK